jgi:uncharacterized protein (DUF362 family)
MTLSRRSFLQTSAAGAAVSLSAGAISTVSAQNTSNVQAGPGNKWPGRVVVNFNKDAVSGVTVETDVARKMVDDAVMLLAGKQTVGEAWKEIFPDTLTATSKIAIKTNILNAGLPCPHASTVEAIVSGLLKMDIDGSSLDAGNITVYDMNNSNSFSKAGYEAANFSGAKLVKDSAADFGDGALNNRSYAKTLNEADFLINVFSPRGHFLGGKVTFGFKSHFGTYSDPSGMHNDADNILAEINSEGPVFNKNILSVCSGLFAMNEGKGPTGDAESFETYAKSIDENSDILTPNTVIVSTDPVSCDMQAMKILKLNKNKSYGTDDMPSYLKNAAGRTYNIGVIEEDLMEIGKIINGEVVVAVSTTSVTLKKKNASSLTVRRLTGSGAVYVEYRVPGKYIGRSAAMDVYNAHGKLIFSRRAKVNGVINQLSWNCRTGSGRRVSNGKYIFSVAVGAKKLTDTLLISG